MTGESSLIRRGAWCGASWTQSADCSQFIFEPTMFRVRQESIPYAAHRQQVPGISRIVLNVPSQPDHKIVDGARVGIFVQPPHFFENLLARHDTSVVPHEMSQ